MRHGLRWGAALALAGALGLGLVAPAAATPPVLRLVVSPSPPTGTAPLLVTLDASGTTDLDGDALRFEWDFDGDGVVDQRGPARTSHTYTEPGTYRLLLEVSDGTGESVAEEVVVTVIAPHAADLSLQKVDSADPVLEGAEFQYTLTVANAGPDGADAVQVEDILPDGVSFVSALGCTHSGHVDGGTVTCDLGAVAASSSVARTITMRASGTGTVENAATVSSTALDPEASNNTDTESTTIRRAARLVDSEIALGAGAFVGLGTTNATGVGQHVLARLSVFQSATFTVRIHNQGEGVDAFTVGAPAGNSGYQVRYMDGTTDITRRVVAGTHSTGPLAAGAVDELVVRVRPRLLLARLRPHLQLPITAVSNAEPSSLDTVVAEARLVTLRSR